MRRVSKFIFPILLIAAWVGCKYSPSSTPIFDNNDKKEKLPYLEIRIQQTTYKLGEPIRVAMVLKNPTPDSYQVDGIYPDRQSANPPRLELTRSDGLTCWTDGREGIVPNLLTTSPIEIRSASDVLLIDADITKIGWACPSIAGAVAIQQLTIGKYRLTGNFFATGFTGGRWQHFFNTPASIEFEIR